MSGKSQKVRENVKVRLNKVRVHEDWERKRINRGQKSGIVQAKEEKERKKGTTSELDRCQLEKMTRTTQITGRGKHEEVEDQQYEISRPDPLPATSPSLSPHDTTLASGCSTTTSSVHVLEHRGVLQHVGQDHEANLGTPEVNLVGLVGRREIL